MGMKIRPALIAGSAISANTDAGAHVITSYSIHYTKLYDLRSRSVEQKGQITAAFIKTVLPKLADRTIVPLIHAVLPLEQVAQAHAMMESSEHFGKIVLRVATSK